MMNALTSPDSVDGRLQRLLGGPDRARLRLRMRRHFERLDDGTASELIHLRNLNPQELDTVVGMGGRASRSSDSARVDISQVDTLLRDAGIARSLREALEQLDGPIVSKRIANAAALAAWLAISQSPHHHEKMRNWLATATALPVLKRLSGGQPLIASRLLEHADVVLSCLPAKGIPRSQLAAQSLGDAHALDKGRPVATVVLAAWRHGENIVEPQAEPTCDEPDRATDVQPDERIRDIWARAGVLVNELARPALCLNLPVTNESKWQPTHGEPDYLSLRRLLRNPPAWAVRDKTIFVCENPNVVAIAAEQLGDACAPLVCTDGMPSAAQQTLLGQLRDAGARLTYHGDFDWPGLRIGNLVMQTWSASPWRFLSTDYQTAIACTTGVRHPLSGNAEDACWDPALTSVMKQVGAAIAEEAVASALIDDLTNVASA
ncbi:TIGR02679 family protein [Paraburkholderia bannensis]|uniref:TIGR02679 family protein n=1 Tax=Paraburkholderia bannensis TaxID=765414 RepID=UPI002ABD7CAF|nr:TIGR02679 family protein [Paraburkholderia bannensis]